MIKCTSKKFQYVLASISTLLFVRGLYFRDSSNIIPTDESIFLIFIYYVFILPGFIWCVWLWNRWLYENMFEDESNPPISYDGFQCIATVVLSILAIYFIVRTFIFPIS